MSTGFENLKKDEIIDLFFSDASKNVTKSPCERRCINKSVFTEGMSGMYQCCD